MKAAVLLVCLALLMVNQAFAAQKLNLGKTSVHYSRDMEYYYQTPKPEILPRLLQSFSQDSYLDYSENRLIMAAFLAQLLKSDKLDCEKFGDASRNLNKNGRATVAWAVHLAQCPNEAGLLARILNDADTTLAKQIGLTPAPLSGWRLQMDNTVIMMRLAAFFASGELSWLDEIIDSALDRQNKYANACAAALYEYAPRHPLIASALRKRLANSNPAQKKVLETILEQSGTF